MPEEPNTEVLQLMFSISRLFCNLAKQYPRGVLVSVLATGVEKPEINLCVSHTFSNSQMSFNSLSKELTKI